MNQPTIPLADIAPTPDNPSGIGEPLHTQPTVTLGQRSIPPEQKKLFIFILASITLFSLVAGGLALNSNLDIRSKAGNTGSVLKLSPATASLLVGQTTPLGVTIATNNDTVSAVELHLTYDPTAIEITGFTPGTVLPIVLVPLKIESGTIAITLGASPSPKQLLKGGGIVGTITIKMLGTKGSTIAFASTTAVAAIGKPTNSLVSSVGTTIGYSQPTTPAPTATASATPTTTAATLTPTHTPTPTIQATPTSTLTPSQCTLLCKKVTCAPNAICTCGKCVPIGQN